MEQQLSALDRVSGLLDGAGIAYWLFGGWAVDFYVGSVTRPHDDLDLAVWLDDLPRIAALLDRDGWRHAPEPDEDGGTGYERNGVRLELTYLVRGGDGRVFTPLRDGQAPWSDEALANDVREFHGVRARLVGLGPLTRGKSSPRDDPADAAKDRADYERLVRESPIAEHRVFRPGGISFLGIPGGDVHRTAAFYRAVFGWNVRDDSDEPAFEDGTGHVIGHFWNDLPVAGASGVRPFVYVERLDETLEEVTANGGEIVDPPYPEGDLLVATFRDPAGNVIGAWQQA